MIMEYYGGYMDTEDIRELFHTDKNGTNAFDIVEGVKRIGFSAKGVFCPADKLLEEELMLPCIANVTINQSYSHFVVIYEINKKKQKLMIADPANKIMEIKLDVFNAIYSGNLLFLYPTQPLLHFEKKKISLRDILILLQDSKKLIMQVFLISIFIIAYVIATSFYSETMLKNLQMNQQSSYFLFLFLIFSILTFLKLTSEFIRTKLILWIEKNVDILLTKDIFFKVLFLPYCYYHNHTSGDILSRMNGINDIKVAISKWLMVLIVDIPLMLISFICLYILHSKLAIIIALFFVLQLFVLKLFSNPLKERIEECQKENAYLSTLEVEGIQSFETIKGISLENYFYKKWVEQKISFIRKIHSLESIIGVENYIKEFFQEFSSLLLLLFGCLFVKEDSLQFSTLLTIQTLSTYFYTPVGEFIDLNRDTKQALVAWKRLSILSRKDSRKGLFKNYQTDTIIFRDVTYSYRPSMEVLHHVNLTIKKQGKVLVLGSSGSGKSTLFKLLKRYYEVPRNKIFLGTNDINDYDNVNFVSYIHQNENLYTGSMLENIVLGVKIDECYLKKICKICKLDEIINREQLGYYQLIEENGINLSGGERQRIVLARTLLKPFSILIIDEELNQLDVNLERKILKDIFHEFYDKTIIVISHREENLDLFSHKVRMSHGKIIEDVEKC